MRQPFLLLPSTLHEYPLANRPGHPPEPPTELASLPPFHIKPKTVTVTTNTSILDTYAIYNRDSRKFHSTFLIPIQNQKTNLLGRPMAHLRHLLPTIERTNNMSQRQRGRHGQRINRRPAPVPRSRQPRKAHQPLHQLTRRKRDGGFGNI
jgi:hypothetical protein